MKRGKLLGALLLFLLPIFLWVGLANAQTFRSGNVTTVGKDETVDSTLWASGRTIDVAGRVQGDIFCAGQHVTVSGTVDGDVICAAQTITVSGTVNGDVRLAAQTVDIGGQVAGNATIASQKFDLTSSGRVGGDVSTGANDVILNGQVGRDFVGGSTTVSIAGTIGRNVKTQTTDLSLEQNARVGGNLDYTSANEADIADGAQISGNTKRSEPAPAKDTDTLLVSGFKVMLYVVASLLLLSLVLTLLMPGVLQQTTNLALARPFWVLMIGLIASLLVPVLFVLLAVTVIGIPLALLLLWVWLLVLFLSGPFFAYYVGRLLLRNNRNPFLIMAIGSLVVLVLFFVPFLGWLLWLVAMWMGAGMILLELRRSAPRPSYELAAPAKVRQPKA